MIGTAAYATLAAVAGYPWLRGRFRRRVTAKMRHQAVVATASLSQGETRYRWMGRARGPVVVCIHGLTQPSEVWDPLVPHLAQMGFRILSYDLYGRGYSDRPGGPQTPDFFADQLEELLDHLGVTEELTLAGYSMGGVIAARYAARHPARVRHLMLLASGGMEIDLDGPTRFARDWPFLGDWLFHLRFPRQNPDLRDQIARRGYLAAVLSSLRNSLRKRRERDHRIIAAENLPVTAIWGRDDPVVPLTAMGRLAQWNRSAHHEVIDDAGHDLLPTHADAVGETLSRMLEAQRAAG